MERDDYDDEEWYCTWCGIAMGPNNPRQLCGKWRCLYLPAAPPSPPPLPPTPPPPPPPTSNTSVSTPTPPLHPQPPSPPPAPLRRRLLIPYPLSPPIPGTDTPITNPSPPPMRGRRRYRMKSRCPRCLSFSP